MSTRRSRGIDMIAVAFLLGSSRTTMIVSERGGIVPSPKRRSDPRTRIVCGLPGSTLSSSFSMSGIGIEASWKTWMVLSTWSSTALATAVADSRTMRTAPTTNFFAIARASRGGPSGLMSRLHPSPVDRARRLAVLAGGGRREPGGRAGDEVAEGAAVAVQGVDRHPFRGAVVAAADGPELDRRDAGLEERDRVRGAVAADREGLALE